MNKELKRMQKLAGIKLQENYELDESAAENLELKSFSKQLFAFGKKNGAISKYVDIDSTDKVKAIGKNKSGMDFRQNPHLYINVRKDDIYINMVGNGVEELYKKIVNSYPKFEFENYKVSKELFGEKTLPLIEFTVKSKTTGKKGGVMATEALNEHYMAGGIVGVGAINQIPPREKSDYEMAFEHFMTEEMDPITGTDIDDIDMSSSVPDFGDDEITGTSLEEEDVNENQKFKTPEIEQAHANLDKSVIAWRKATMPLNLQKEEEFKAFETALSKMVQMALAKDVRAN